MSAPTQTSTGVLPLTPEERPAFWATFAGPDLDGF